MDDNSVLLYDMYLEAKDDARFYIDEANRVQIQITDMQFHLDALISEQKRYNDLAEKSLRRAEALLEASQNSKD